MCWLGGIAIYHEVFINISSFIFCFVEEIFHNLNEFSASPLDWDSVGSWLYDSLHILSLC